MINRLADTVRRFPADGAIHALLYVVLIVAGTALAVAGAVVWERIDPDIRDMAEVVWRWARLALAGGLLVVVLRGKDGGIVRRHPVLVALLSLVLVLELFFAVSRTLEL